MHGWHPRRLAKSGPIRRALVASLLAGALGGPLGLALADWGEWNFNLILQTAERQYGSLGSARDRIEGWHELLRITAGLSEQERLTEVNRFFNRTLRFNDDIQIWQQVDYWATPVEALVKGAADCEDYAIAKYFTLRRLGVSSERLRITYVKALGVNQAHMVLTYYATPTAEPLVLDNLDGVIRPASQRTDLLPVYAFNAEGLYLPGAGGGKRSGDSKRLSRWQDILTKMRAEGFSVGEG